MKKSETVGLWTHFRAVIRPSLLAILVAIATGALGCSKRDASMARSSSPEPVAAATTGASVAPSADRAVRITVEMTVVTKHRDQAVAAVRAALADLGGFVASGSVSGEDGNGSASFEVKVPARDVGTFRARMAALGEVRRDSEKAEDVTEARADLRARLGNARAEESRMLALLAEKTGNLADVVAVEKELAAVRETIERFEAQERVLEGQIAMATVKVEVVTAFMPEPTGAIPRLAEAGREGIETAWGFLVGTGVLLLAAGPTLMVLGLFGAVMFFSVRRLRRVRRAA
jgi:hypothetical protein